MSRLNVDQLGGQTTSNIEVISGNTLKVGVIAESSTNNGVTIDGVLIRDGAIASSYITGAGKVLQVVTAETSTATVSTSTTYSDTTLTGSITPSATSSKILVLIAQEYNYYASNTTFIKAGIKVVRTIGATDTDIKETAGLTLNSATGTMAQWGGVLPITILDSPSTTSSITYKTQQHKEATDTQITTQPASEKSTITLIEIGA